MMARSWHYPRWRRYAMQAVIWLILLATIGLAALVNHEQRRALMVPLASPTPYEGLAISLPQYWQQLASDGDERVVVRAIEPANRGGRVLSIMRDPLRTLVSPLEYLIRGTAVHGIDIIGPQRRDPGEPIAVGGWPGAMVRFTIPPPPGESAPSRSETYACTVLPSQEAILIKLESTDGSQAADLALVRQIAEAMKIIDQPVIGRAGETLSFDGSISAIVPAGLAPVHRSDPLQLERQLWTQGGDGKPWTAVTLVPCLLVPDGDDLQAIHTLLVTRDPRLRGASIQAIGSRSWRIDPTPELSDQIFRARLYLVADERSDGTITAGPRRALLAVFRGGLFADQNFDATWDGLSKTVEFKGDVAYRQMLQNGADEVARLRTVRLNRLLPETGDEWWVWKQDNRYRGWTHIAWNARDETGQRLLKWRGADRRLKTMQESWSGNLVAYTCRSEAADVDTQVTPGLGASETTQLKQSTTLEGNRLSVLTSTGSATEGSWTGLAPPQFVPGAWLPLLLGQLKETPMILRADTFIGLEGIGPRDAMTLIITPSSTTMVDEKGNELRTVTVQVSGTGQVSRWYYRKDNTLDHVEFAGGLQRIKQSAGDIEFLFSNDPAVKPAFGRSPSSGL